MFPIYIPLAPLKGELQDGIKQSGEQSYLNMLNTSMIVHYFTIPPLRGARGM